MDDFLNQMREAPRPEYTESLRQRLDAADRRAKRQVARTTLLGAAGTACAALGLVFALRMPLVFHPAEAGNAQTVAVSALLLPVVEPRVVPARAGWTEITVTLHAPPTPISHHHQANQE